MAKTCHSQVTILPFPLRTFTEFSWLEPERSHPMIQMVVSIRRFLNRSSFRMTNCLVESSPFQSILFKHNPWFFFRVFCSLKHRSGMDATSTNRKRRDKTQVISVFWKVIFALIPPPVRRFKGDFRGGDWYTWGWGYILPQEKRPAGGAPCAFCAFFFEYQTSSTHFGCFFFVGQKDLRCIFVGFVQMNGCVCFFGGGFSQVFGYWYWCFVRILTLQRAAKVFWSRTPCRFKPFQWRVHGCLGLKKNTWDVFSRFAFNKKLSNFVHLLDFTLRRCHRGGEVVNHCLWGLLWWMGMFLLFADDAPW